MADESVSPRIIEQRIRNRLIEYFELAGSNEVQRKYQEDVPFVSVPYEVIDQWDDWVRGDPPSEWFATSAVFSADEADALGEFYDMWRSVHLPDDYPALSDVQATPDWGRLRSAALAAAAVFTRRGRMPEDHEAECQ